jgi:hypothetical protein
VFSRVGMDCIRSRRNFAGSLFGNSGPWVSFVSRYYRFLLAHALFWKTQLDELRAVLFERLGLGQSRRSYIISVLLISL